MYNEITHFQKYNKNSQAPFLKKHRKKRKIHASLHLSPPISNSTSVLHHFFLFHCRPPPLFDDGVLTPLSLSCFATRRVRFGGFGDGVYAFEAKPVTHSLLPLLLASKGISKTHTFSYFMCLVES